MKYYEHIPGSLALKCKLPKAMHPCTDILVFDSRVGQWKFVNRFTGAAVKLSGGKEYFKLTVNQREKLNDDCKVGKLREIHEFVPVFKQNNNGKTTNTRLY